MIMHKSVLRLTLTVILAFTFVPLSADRDGRRDGERDKVRKYKQQGQQQEEGKWNKDRNYKIRKSEPVERAPRSEDRKYKTGKPVPVEQNRRRDLQQKKIIQTRQPDRGNSRNGRVHKKPHSDSYYKKKEGYMLDKRFRHNHYYPRRGYSIRKLPLGHRVIRHRGKRYFHYHGIWYHYSGTHYVVIRPPLGLRLLFLPPIYTTIWVGGSAYYYANDVYYIWEPRERVYVVSEPPHEDEIDEQLIESEQLFVYPKRGQSVEKQASDRYQCHQWANQQTGFDPTLPGGNVAASIYQSKRADYRRAMKACLEARGYSVQ